MRTVLRYILQIALSSLLLAILMAIVVGWCAVFPTSGGIVLLGFSLLAGGLALVSIVLLVALWTVDL